MAMAGNPDRVINKCGTGRAVQQNIPHLVVQEHAFCTACFLAYQMPTFSSASSGAATTHLVDYRGEGKQCSDGIGLRLPMGIAALECSEKKKDC